HFAPMLDRIEAECGRLPTKVTADAGYFSEQNVRLAEERGLDAYIAVGRERSSERSVSPRGRPRLDLTPRARMARKLSTKRGTETYRKRKAIVEAPIGHIKEILGVRSFSLRGLSKVRREWSLICMVHNILNEPPRLSRRLHHLRGWSNGEAKKEVPHRGQGTSSADGDGVRGGPRLPVGSDSIDRLEDRLHARNP